MLGVLFYWLYGKALKALHREIEFSEKAYRRFEIARSHTIMCIEGIEVHLFLVYVYPFMYPALHLASRITGIDTSGMYYGGH